jgi:predicted DNA-binding helix-hairpin-helix protein
MFAVIDKPDTLKKLQILSADAQYDLACACGSTKYEHRKRDTDNKWIYPVTLPNGGRSFLFKTLLSNSCVNDCKYCPLRQQSDVQRCSLKPEQAADLFMDYLHAGEVGGLFLSSATFASPDNTMDRLNSVVKIIRKKYAYRGYVHLKIIPGSSPAAIEEALSLSTAVSLNIETPGKENLAKLSTAKDYIKDIIEPMKLINRLTAKGAKYEGVRQTTQFIVGAAGESDRQIVKYTAALYQRLNMHRVYFSAYQRGLGDQNTIGEKETNQLPSNIFTREHRLYQVDFLLRKYKFNESDFYFEANENLSMEFDPKQIWADRHPEFFPVNINRASKYDLLRVPGLGPRTVNRILDMRKASAIHSLHSAGLCGKRLQKANPYLTM